MRPPTSVGTYIDGTNHSPAADCFQLFLLSSKIQFLPSVCGQCRYSFLHNLMSVCLCDSGADDVPNDN